MSEIYNNLKLLAAEIERKSNSLRAIAANNNITVPVDDWEGIRALVRAGVARNVFSVGDQLQCKKGATVLTWDILDFDHDTPVDTDFTHSMTIQLHDCYYSTVQFDAKEALYYCESALPAGTYNFTVTGYGQTTAGTYQFTTTTEVPAGGQLVITGDPYSTAITSLKVEAYTTKGGTTTVWAAADNPVISAGSGGTALSPTNHIQRMCYGSNNWFQSAERQWMNCLGAAGSWWTPQTNFDRPPSQHGSVAGFLNGIDSDFLSVIGEVTKVTNKNNVTDGGGSESHTEKFFLPSISEVFMSATLTEGNPYKYYQMYSDLASAGTGADRNRIKYDITAKTTPRYWWLRSPYTGNAYNQHYVGPAGASHSSYAYNSYGVSPACNIV